MNWNHLWSNGRKITGIFLSMTPDKTMVWSRICREIYRRDDSLDRSGHVFTNAVLCHRFDENRLPLFSSIEQEGLARK